jgi:magnesium-transporting ATPase (P-type)
MLRSIVIGIFYTILNRKVKSEDFKQKVFVNLEAIFKLRKLTWIIWIFFIIVSTLYTTAIRFGSNIWFSTAISITGPYQFAELAVRYLLPFLSVTIPLIVNALPKLISRYEVGEHNEIKA